MRSAWIEIVVIVFGLGFGAPAAAQVAIGEVTGPTGAQVGYAVEQALRDKIDVVPNRVWEQTASALSLPPDATESLAPVATELDAYAIIVGDVSRVGRKWQGKLQVYEVASREFTKEWVFDTSSLRNLSKIARRQAWSQLGAAVRAAEKAEPATGPPAPTGPRAAPRNEPTVRRVVLLPFKGGKRADGVRKIVANGLDAAPDIERVDEGEAIGTAREIGVILKDPIGRVAVAELLNLNAYIFGEVFYRRGWYYAVVEVDQGLDGAEVETLKLKRRGMVALGNALFERLRASIRSAEAPFVPEEEPLDDMPPPAPVAEAQPEAEARAEPDRARRPRGSDARSRTPLEVTLGFTSFFRSFDFNQPITPQRPYEASFAPAIAFAARWYPAAHFSDEHWARNLGVDLSADYAIGLTSSDSASDDEFPTNAFSFLGGVRGRLPLGASELGAGIAFGTDRFALDPAGDVEPETPDVEYVFARFGVDGRWRVIEQLDLGFAGGYRVVTDAGEILSDDWFPKGDVGAFDVTAKVGTPILDPVHFEAGVSYLHYFFSFNVDVDDAAAGNRLAGGALDQYTHLFLRAVLVL